MHLICGDALHGHERQRGGVLAAAQHLHLCGEARHLPPQDDRVAVQRQIAQRLQCELT